MGGHTITHHNLVERSRVMGKVFLEKMKRLLQYEIVGDVRGKGLMVGIEFLQDTNTKQPFQKHFNISKKIGEKSIQRGVILYPGKGSADGELGDHILLTRPLIVNEQQIETIVKVLEECIKEIIVEENLVKVQV